MSKAILVFGATGKQGRSVIGALIEYPSFSPSTHTIYAVTRNTGSPSAQKLASKSSAIKLIQGDFNNVQDIFQSLPLKPWGVYIVTNPGKNEAEEGIAIVNEALAAGCEYIVFSSVDRGSEEGGNVPTNVPHFKTKHQIEARLREAAEGSRGQLHYTILRPAFFLDNLEWGFAGKIVSTVWRDHVPKTKPLAVISTTDIGKFAASAFMEPESPEYKNKELNLAGDSLTFEQANKIFLEKTGNPIPVTFGFIASLVLWFSEDFREMARFWENPGFGANPEESQRLHTMKDFAAWVEQSSFVPKKSN